MSSGRLFPQWRRRAARTRASLTASDAGSRSWCISLHKSVVKLLFPLPPQPRHLPESPATSVAEATSQGAPEYEVCKNAACAEKWRKAKHWQSGYCTSSCAEAAGWTPTGNAFPPPSSLASEDPASEQSLSLLEKLKKSCPVMAKISETEEFKGYFKLYEKVKPVDAPRNEKRIGLRSESEAKRLRLFGGTAPTYNVHFVHGGVVNFGCSCSS